MIKFASQREKKLWSWSAVLIFGIYCLIFIGQPLSEFLRDRSLLSLFYWIAIFLTLATVIWYGWNRKIQGVEIGIWLAVITVYLLLFLRMASPEERSHLIEYGVLAVVIHEALIERKANGLEVWRPPVLAFLITIVIGLVDETIQLFVPGRVFDLFDIFFNTLAAFLALIGVNSLRWTREKLGKLRKKKS